MPLITATKETGSNCWNLSSQQQFSGVPWEILNPLCSFPIGPIYLLRDFSKVFLELFLLFAEEP